MVTMYVVLMTYRRVGRRCPQCSNTMFPLWDEYYGEFWECNNCYYEIVEDEDFPASLIHIEGRHRFSGEDIPLGGE